MAGLEARLLVLLNCIFTASRQPLLLGCRAQYDREKLKEAKAANKAQKGAAKQAGWLGWLTGGAAPANQGAAEQGGGQVQAACRAVAATRAAAGGHEEGRRHQPSAADLSPRHVGGDAVGLLGRGVQPPRGDHQRAGAGPGSA